MKKLIGGVVVFLLAVFVYLQQPSDTGNRGSVDTAPARSTTAITEPSAARDPAAVPRRSDPTTADGVRRVVEDAAVKNYGKVIYRGPVDLSATIERIRAGVRHPHRNDGSVFGNREGLLPRQPRGYYREYVHPTDDLDGPGPQRLVVGRDGDWWYTPDHYASFIALGNEAR